MSCAGNLVSLSHFFKLGRLTLVGEVVDVKRHVLRIAPSKATVAGP